jgi:hypothetical protein
MMDQNQRPNKPTRGKEGGINENRDAGNEGQEGRKASRRTKVNRMIRKM